MGCSHTKHTHAKEKCEAIDYYITPEEKQIIRTSWQVVATDLPGVGLFIFSRLFDLEFDLQKLFKRLLTKTETGQYVLDTTRLEGHAVNVLKRFSVVVENLDNNTALTTTLIALGEVHSGYNVRPDMLPLLWPPIRDGFKYALQDDFTVSVELAWKHLYDFISCHIAEGMIIGYVKMKRESFLHNGSPTANSSPSSPFLVKKEVVSPT
ncbi:hypothetical protein Btru_011982 [Bulinus truncatus]|nr:hypothetical protein Btru_011982 [Bulinus truncatus]